MMEHIVSFSNDVLMNFLKNIFYPKHSIITIVMLCVYQLDTQAQLITNAPQGLQPDTLQTYSVGSIRDQPLLKVGFFPIYSSTIYSTKRPYSVRDGAAWSGKGLSQNIQAGFWLHSTYLTLKVAPFFSLIQNQQFDNPVGMKNLSGQIDMPYYFGEESYHKIYPGESALKFHFNWFEFGVSSEQLFWGAGKIDNLLTGSSSPGLERIYFKSRQPVKLPLKLGEFQYDVIWGFPRTSEFYLEVPDRFLSAFSFEYSPSFIRYLSIGAIRQIVTYQNDNEIKVGQVINIFDAVFASKLYDRPGWTYYGDGDQQISFFIKYEKEKVGSIYAEFARNDRNFDLRDLFTNPHNRRGYLLGFSKIFIFQSEKIINFTFETYNTGSTILDQIRDTDALYTGLVAGGFTNYGQIFGISNGEGATGWSFNFEYQDQSIRYELIADFTELRQFFYFEANDIFRPKDSSTHYTNLNFGLSAEFKLNRFTLIPAYTISIITNEYMINNRDLINHILSLTTSVNF